MSELFAGLKVDGETPFISIVKKDDGTAEIIGNCTSQEAGEMVDALMRHFGVVGDAKA